MFIYFRLTINKKNDDLKHVKVSTLSPSAYILAKNHLEAYNQLNPNKPANMHGLIEEKSVNTEKPHTTKLTPEPAVEVEVESTIKGTEVVDTDESGKDEQKMCVQIVI